MIAVSDSVATHGLCDGRYTFNGQGYIVQNGVSRCVDGTLDGGGVYLDGAVRNLQSVGIPAAEACRMASTLPLPALDCAANLPPAACRLCRMERRLAGTVCLARRSADCQQHLRL